MKVDWSFTQTYHHKPYEAISPTRPELSAKGKVVVVTGGSRGIGLAIAASFAKAGAAHVVIIGRSQHTLQNASKDVEQAGSSKVHTFVADIADHDAIDKVFSDIAKNIGSIDVAVSNAGVTKAIPIKDIDVADFWATFETNTKGPFNVAKAFLKTAAKNGVLIGITSGVAHWLPSQWGPVASYAGSKAAFSKVYEYLQAENPEFRIFTLQPGVIATELAHDAGKMDEADYPDVAELPGDFSVWLASGEADFLKGKLVYANWDVDELKARAEEIEADPALFTIALGGWGVGGTKV